MRKIHITRLATVAGALAIASVASAADPSAATSKVKMHFTKPTPEMMAKYGNQAAAPQTGMRAFVDPSTGKLRDATQADLDESAAASAAAAKKTAKVAAPVAQKRGNGTRVALDASYLSYAVATIGPDGKVKQECVEQQPDEKAALRTAAAQQGADRHEK